MTFCNNDRCLTKDYCSVHISKAAEFGLQRNLLNQENLAGDEFMCPIASAKAQAEKDKKKKHIK